VRLDAWGWDGYGMDECVGVGWIAGSLDERLRGCGCGCWINVLCVCVCARCVCMCEWCVGVWVRGCGCVGVWVVCG